MRAMVELETRGLAVSRPRSGFFAQRPAGSGPAIPAATRSGRVPMTVDIRTLATEILGAIRSPGLFPLGAAEVDRTLLPIADLAACAQAAMRRHGVAMLAAQDPLGVPMLRRAIARHLMRRGLDVPPDEIVVTAGETDAMALALQAVTKPGDVVAVESPAFFGTLQEIELAGLRAIEIATDPETGIDVDDLVRTADSVGIGAVVLNPIFQNPFGFRMRPHGLSAVARAMAERSVPVIEDDVYGDLGFAGEPARPPASYDRARNTIYCASFSKIVSSGLRVGWCWPGRHREAVLDRQLRRPATVSSLSQYTLAEYLAGRRYARHIARLRSLFAAQQPVVRGLVGDSFPRGTRVTAPEGGFLFWIEVPQPFDALRFYGEALRAGISIAPGPVFSPSGRFRGAFRISVGRKLDERTRHALATLGCLAREAA
jgi:DNA-binding transcriptional MocR family regulator